MQRIVITLPDTTYQRLMETIKSMGLQHYTPEKWVSELVVCEMAARRSRNASSNQPATQRPASYLQKTGA